MKKVVFIAVLLIVLGTVWTLYLEYSNKRFVDSMPKAPAAVTQPADPSDAHPAANENAKTATVHSVPAEPIAEKAPVANGHTETLLTPHADTLEMRHSLTGASAQENPVQTPSRSNPVPPEVIEDSKRDLEWWRADREYRKKFWALHEERKQLYQELKSLGPPDPNDLVGWVDNMSDEEKASHRAKLKALMEKYEDLQKRYAKLKTEKPVRPTPTHTH